MATAKGFRELDVYKKALLQAGQIFRATASFPSEEKYALTDQVRRSSRAVGALVAEAWARRRYRAAFISKLVEALGEAMETQAWLDHARLCRYVSDAQYRDLDREWQQIGGMLRRMIQCADRFCTSASDKKP